MAAHAPDAEEKARRVRSLLSSYYTTNDGGAGAATTRAAASIDSAAFDADAFTAALLKKARLEQLHSKYTSMASEIRTLDSDMQARARARGVEKRSLTAYQMLVYENYSKFITATDTIRRMKSNVEEMGGRMVELQSTIAATAAASEHVNAKLAKHRAEIEQLNAVRGLLKKVQHVFGLPSRLRAALELGALPTAVAEYAAAAPLLERYGQGAFAAVAAEVAPTVRAVGERLRQQLRDPATRPDDAGAALELLQQLRLPQDELQREWCGERRALLVATLEAARAAWAAASPSPHAAASPDAAAWLAQLDGRFHGELRAAAKAHAELFPDSAAGLAELAKASLADYFRLVKEALAPPPPPPPPASPSPPGALPTAQPPPATPPARPLMTGAALAVALAGMAQRAGALSREMPSLRHLRIGDRAAEVVELAARRHVAGCFSHVEARAAAQLADVKSRLESSAAGVQSAASAAETHAALVKMSDRAAAAMGAGLGDAVADAAALRDAAPQLLSPWRDVYADGVRAQAAGLFVGLAATFMAACKLPPMPEAASSLIALAAAQPEAPAAPPVAAPVWPPPAFVLFLVRLCGALDAAVVPAAAEKVGACFPEGGSAFDAPAISKLLRAASARLLAGYVQQRGRSLSRAVREAMAATDWVALPEPKGPRPICDTLLTALAATAAQVAAMLPPDGGGGSAPPAAHAPPPQHHAPQPPAPTDTSHISRNVAKLFSQKVRIFEESFPTRASVLLGIVKIVLKSWVENVRLATLGRFGFQQLLLDVHFMRPAVRGYSGAAPGVADSLLDDVAAAAADRCGADPVALDEGAMDGLLQAARAARGAA